MKHVRDALLITLVLLLTSGCKDPMKLGDAASKFKDSVARFEAKDFRGELKCSFSDISFDVNKNNSELIPYKGYIAGTYQTSQLDSFSCIFKATLVYESPSENSPNPSNHASRRSMIRIMAV